MERVTRGPSPQSWALVMPRFMDSSSHTPLSEHRQQALITQLLAVDRRDRQLYTNNLPGKMSFIGLDASVLPVALQLGRQKLCSELSLFQESTPLVNQWIPFLQQTCLLAGSSTLISHSVNPNILQNAQIFIVTLSQWEKLSRHQNALLSTLNQYLSAEVILYGDATHVLQWMPYFSEALPNANVIGIEQNERASSSQTMLHYIESIVLQRPFQGAYLKLPEPIDSPEPLAVTTIHELSILSS